MSALFPLPPAGGRTGREPPGTPLQERLTAEQAAARWEVRAAQWRALELAQAAFGGPVKGTLLALRARGALRGLLKVDVPFDDLESHARREAAFLGMVRADPLMAEVPLVFVVGPDGA